MDILEIIKRVKESCCYCTDAALARALNMSPQNFSSQKKTGKIKDTLIVHAVSKGINHDWIITGQGSMKSERVADRPIAEPEAHYSSAKFILYASPQNIDLIQKTAAVLESPTIYNTALRSNIEAFHEAITLRDELKQYDQRIRALESSRLSLENKKSSG